MKAVPEVRQEPTVAIEPGLLHRIKLLALQERKQLGEVVAEALEEYLAARGKSGGGRVSAVRETRGKIPAGAEQVRRVLEEEGFLEI
ncbi:MAG: hypothetical protein AB1776_06165 [Bacillota bacterium]